MQVLAMETGGGDGQDVCRQKEDLGDYDSSDQAGNDVSGAWNRTDLHLGSCEIPECNPFFPS